MKSRPIKIGFAPPSIGDSLKILQVRGLAGMTLPPYHITEETSIQVQECRAQLKISDSKHLQKRGPLLLFLQEMDMSLRSERNLMPWPESRSISNSILYK